MTGLYLRRVWKAPKQAPLADAIIGTNVDCNVVISSLATIALEDLMIFGPLLAISTAYFAYLALEIAFSGVKIAFFC